ncbi:MAG: LysE family transporter [Rhodospirillaceae bacterium]|nr:LysE family transporter [Rhodospirillaceae bacterium]
MFPAYPFDLALLKGLIAGFAMAAPIGAVGIMCIRRAITFGVGRALVPGLGSALADAIFGAAAGLGLTVISAFVVAYEAAIGLVGGLIVLGVGVATYLAPVRTDVETRAPGDRRKDIARAFSMSIANPATMLGALGIFAAFGPIDPAEAPGDAAALVGGVFAGSMLWWLVLATTARALKDRFVTGALPRLNRIEGLIIGACGAAILAVSVAAWDSGPWSG